MQPRPFEELIEKGHQQDANLRGACARSTNERSLVRGGGRYNKGSFVYLAKACGSWVFAGVNKVVWVDVDQQQKSAIQRSLILLVVAPLTEGLWINNLW